VTPHRSSLVKAFWATLLFGSVPACIKLIHIDSYALGIWRLSLAAIGMSALVMAQRRSAAAVLAEVRRHWPILTAVGVSFGLHWLTYFQSIKIANASIGSLGFSTCGVQLPLLGWLFGFGRPGWSALLGVVLAMVGSILAVPEYTAGGGEALGMAVGILSGTFYAIVPMLHQRHAYLDHELRTWAQFVFALPVFLVTAPLAQWHPISTRDFWIIIHLGLVVNLIGHYLWVQVSTELPLTLTSALGYLQLPASLAFNVLLTDERLTAAIWLGAVLIIAGNLLALGTNKQPPIEAEPPVD
jgi:drug/metabolite transporter (DMT)-like permease